MTPRRKVLIQMCLLGSVPAIGVVATTAIVRNLNQQWDDLAHDPRVDFYATGNLTRRITPEEAETIETYSDPLDDGIRLPFGHLSNAWKRFLLQRPNRAKLWAFDSLSKREQVGWRRRDKPGRGYAWVVKGMVEQEIIVEG